MPVLSSFYLVGIFTLAFILRFGVAKAVFDPSHTVRGLFLLACLVGGAIGGILLVVFRSGGLLLSASLGGFALGLALQACKDDGLISSSPGLRWLLYLGLATATFCLACHPKLQSPTLIFSTAITGATSLVLGVDCFTRANLKEFYVRNIGFDDIFEKRHPDTFSNHRWHLSQACVIELGVVAALTLMGIGLQTKMWSELKASLRHMRNDDEERRLQSRAKRAAKRIFASAQRDLEAWEERHGYKKTSSSERNNGATKAAATGNNTKTNKVEEQGRLVMPSSPAFDESKPFIGAGSPMTPRSMDIYRSGTPIHARRTSEATTLYPMDTFSSTKGPLTGYFDQEEKAQAQAQRRRESESPAEDAQKLHEEINAIRRSIHELSTSITPPPPSIISHDRSQTPLSFRERASSEAGLLGQQPRSTSPWLTDDRSRSRAFSSATMSGALPMPALDFHEPVRTTPSPSRYTPVDETLFQGDAPQPFASMQRTGSSPAAFSPTSSNNTVRPLAQDSDQSISTARPTQPRSKSSAWPGEAAGATNRQSQQKQSPDDARRRRPSQQNSPSSRPSSAMFLQQHLHHPQQQQEKRRSVIDTPENSEARYKAALGREPRRSLTGQPDLSSMYAREKRHSTTSAMLFQAHQFPVQLHHQPLQQSPAMLPPASRFDAGGATSKVKDDKRDMTMSVSELQDRHKSRLSALQRPTSMRIDEEATLQKAKEDWERRVKMEKRAWEREEKKRLEEEKAQRKAAASPRRASRIGKTMALDEMKSSTDDEGQEVDEDEVPLDQLDKARRRKSSGTAKAIEWRQSFVGTPPSPVPVLSRPQLPNVRASLVDTQGSSRPTSPGPQQAISPGSNRAASPEAYFPQQRPLTQQQQQQSAHRTKRTSSYGSKPLLDFRMEELRAQNHDSHQRKQM